MRCIVFFFYTHIYIIVNTLTRKVISFLYTCGTYTIIVVAVLVVRVRGRVSIGRVHALIGLGY